MKKSFSLVLFLLAALVLVTARTPLQGRFFSAPAAALSTDYIITWQEDPALDHLSLLDTVFSSHPDAAIDISYDDADFTLLTLRADKDSSLDLLADLASTAGILAIEEDAVLDLTGFTNDYFSDSQWSFNNTGSYSHIEASTTGTIATTPDIDIDIPEGWALYATDTTGRQPVIVAVIDTGIDYSHPELASSMWVNTVEIPGNGRDDDKNGYIDDIYGWDFYNGDSSVCHYEYSELYRTNLSSPSDCDDHGTHVAGIIAARANNEIGIAGAAACADVRLMSLKIHGGPDRKGNISDAVKAIKYASMMGARICNLSWGSYTESTSLYTAILRSNMLFVCAAGNDGTDNDSRPLYPASYKLDNIISTTFVDANGKLTYDSNYGRSSIDLAVPSTDIFSTIVGTYASMSGSSMAAPQLSAIAAVIYSYGPGLSATTVKSLICNNIKPLDTLTRLVKHPGIPSLYKALLALDQLEYDHTPPTFTMHKSFMEDGIRLTFTREDDLSGPGLIKYYIGTRRPEDFDHGASGSLATDNTVILSKPGFYTFYLDDRAGNYECRTVLITDDMVAPSITETGFTVNFTKDLLTLKAQVTDLGSGVRSIKFARGKQPASFFTGGGQILEADEDGQVTFSTPDQGTYTLCATDYRGNRSVSYLMAYIRASESLTLRRNKKTLNMGESYSLNPVMTPARTTDLLEFTSSDPAVASVTDSGRVTAHSIGTAIITGVTASGHAATCIITVR